MAILLLVLFAACHEKETSEAPLLFLPGDLQAELWAESPLLYNPTNIDVDSKGRIWVTEAVNYRNYNNDSTKALHHAKGDRIMILEDTDGDGSPDDSKVFVQDEDFVSPLGIAVIANKVYVSCSPHLIVYTDTDGDDDADTKDILLTGFGGLDHDHSLHAVVGGMDGRLYFNTGNAGPHIVTDRDGWTLRSGSVYTGGSPYNTTNRGNMKSDDGKVWVGGLALRMSPSGGRLEVLAHNFRNAYELAVDSRGDLWQNDNDDQVVACRTTWVMEGGDAGYFSSDGTRSWQADQRPWQDVFTAHWHQDDPGVMPAGDNAGAGSPTGIVVNESDSWGTEYLGMLLSADAGRNVIFGYHPVKQRSGYTPGRRLNFITSLREDNAGYVWNDSANNAQSEKWFRPSDVAFGTDGALYIADWYDPVVGGHQMQDTVAHGRIYRISPKAKKLSAPQIDFKSVEGQLEGLRSPAVNVRYTALQKLVERGPEIIPQVRKLLGEKNPYHRARAVWLLSQLGAEGLREVEGMLDDEDDEQRIVAFRSLRQAKKDVLPYAGKLAGDPSARVRRELIIALTGLPLDQKQDHLITLAMGYDGEDRWYLEALGNALKGHESAIYPKLLSAFDATTQDPESWNKALSSLVWRLHPPEAVRALWRRASSGSLPEADRSEALTALAFVKTQSAVEAMLALTRNENETIAGQARYWISFRQGNDWFGLWNWSGSDSDLASQRRLTDLKIKRARIMDPQMPLNEKKWSASSMARDAVGARMLLGLVSEQQLPAALYSHVESLITENTDPSVRILASRYFGAKSTAENFTVSEIVKLPAFASAGRSVFEKNCASCHRIKGMGMQIGPDLTEIKNKLDRGAILQAIIHPDAGIVFGYEAWTINLSDGQSFYGFLLGESEQTVTMKDLAGNKHVIQTSLIRSRKKDERSLMPSSVALGLSQQDLADLSHYLLNVE